MEQRAHRFRKIAVVRANGVGDYLFSEPALQALRSAYPRAQIVLLGKHWHRQFLSGRPGPVDRVIVVPRCPGVGAEPHEAPDTAALDDFFRVMEHEQFDLAVQLHGGGRYSNPFTRRLGARFTIGLQAEDAAPLDRVIPYYYFQPEVLRYLEVVSLVGAAPVRLEPSLALTPADCAEADALDLPRDRPWVLLHPGATDPRRHWPAPKFAALADTLARHGARILVNGTGPERAVVDAVIGRMRAPAVDLYGRVSLGGLAAVLARCAVVVANDSGPLHLAAAVGTSTVGIYWCGNFINGGPVMRRRHRPSMSWRLNCPICGQNTLTDPCTHSASFVADVDLHEVTRSALALLDSATRASAH